MKGMTGKKHSEESKQKMSLAHKGMHLSPATEFKKGISSNNPKRLASLPRGKNHYKWAGDQVSYHGIHEWVKKTLGKPSSCGMCGTEKSKRFMWHNISGEYRRDKNDWERVCARCHANFHKNWEARWLA